MLSRVPSRALLVPGGSEQNWVSFRTPNFATYGFPTGRLFCAEGTKEARVKRWFAGPWNYVGVGGLGGGGGVGFGAVALFCAQHTGIHRKSGKILGKQRIENDKKLNLNLG